MSKKKAPIPKQQAELDKVMDYVVSLGFDFNNSQEMENAIAVVVFLSQAIHRI